MIPNTNDGTQRQPGLRCYLNLLALRGMPEFPEQQPVRDRFETIADAGYEGIQFVEPPGHAEAALCAELGLGRAGGGRVNLAAEAAPLAERLAGEGQECGTLHVGWGLEDDDEAFGLIEAILNASVRHRIPLYVETHRATIFQDMWRTVKFVGAFPDLRFNGDFSHWYAGQEMVYGGFDKKLSFIRPVLERVRFVHGRISNPGCIQVDIGDGSSASRPYVDHFREMWRACFTGFLASAKSGDMICFTPELLAPEIYYARTFPDNAGRPQEESNRWSQSLLLRKIAQECFAESKTEYGTNGRA
jgi:sugar phosphate isomerase/epimerase